MADPVEEVIAEYTRRYIAGEADRVTELCLAPFLAIRSGVAVHLGDRDALREHFVAVMDAYRDAGFATFSPVETEIHRLGEHSCFVTIRWNAMDSGGAVVRDTKTTYHLLALPGEPHAWRFLSYTNHF
jgi:hypothetical protein